MIQVFTVYSSDTLIETYAGGALQLRLNHNKRTFDFFYRDEKFFALPKERQAHLWQRFLDIADYWCDRGYAMPEGLRRNIESEAPP